MTTPKGKALERHLISDLEQRGFSWQLTHWPARMTWFKMASVEEGGPLVEIAMPNLPSDPHHMEKYLRRGFRPDLPLAEPARPAPPETPASVIMDAGPKTLPIAIPEAPDQEIPCPICSKPCKGEFGKRSHMRSHKEK